MNSTPPLVSPPTVTTTSPVVAPAGTATVIDVSLQLAAVAAVPLKVTVLVPCVAPKLVPVISTDVPTGPESGLNARIVGVTVNSAPSLASPPTVTTTPPVVAPAGTAAVIDVSLQLAAVADTPLKVTVLVPWGSPKFPPAIVTDVPSGPLSGFNELMAGTLTTVKAMGLLTWPPTVTTTLPVVAVVGTAAVIEVSLQLVGVASTPLKVTVLVPCVAPKCSPVIVTDAPFRPDTGSSRVIEGAGRVTLKVSPLLAWPPTVTTTGPVAAPAGAGAVIEVSLQLVAVAATPLKVTVLVPCAAPKCTPAIVTTVPTSPDMGSNDMIDGEEPVTLNVTGLLAWPSTVTTTGPVRAPAGTLTVILSSPHFLAVAFRPLKVTVLVPCAVPKYSPLTFTESPTPPSAGFSLLISGGGPVTVKVTWLLDSPPTVTTTGPVAALAGTVTVIEASLQFVGVAATPLKVTVLVPWEAPKFTPPITTVVSTWPRAGLREVTIGSVPTVKDTPLLASPPTVTTTLPEVAPAGTATVIEVLLQLVGVAEIPLKVTVLVPCIAPKLVPVITTVVPSGPAIGLKLPISGVTVKATPSLGVPSTVTTTLPVAAPAGTVTVIEVSLQPVGVAPVPLKVTELVPWDAPKPVPVITTVVPSGPETRLNPAITGLTLNVTPLLAVPSTVTTTGPVVAFAGTVTVIEVSLQSVGVASAPLKVTELVPWDAPKFAPVIATVVPAGPESGFKPLMTGSVPTVKVTPLLASPPTVTTTSPVVAFAGTVTVIEVSLQLVAVAEVPLKVTVLVPCAAPKLVPVISTVAPSGPATGLRLPIAGATVKETPALAVPSTVTTTSPVVAPMGTATVIEVSLQLVGVAPVPLKVTVPVP